MSVTGMTRTEEKTGRSVVCFMITIGIGTIFQLLHSNLKNASWQHEQRSMLKASSKERNVEMSVAERSSKWRKRHFTRVFPPDKRAAAYGSLTCLLSMDALIAPSKSLKIQDNIFLCPANKEDALLCGVMNHADCELQHS